MVCDCCDRDEEHMACYPTEDNDAVWLCGECHEALTRMIEGSPMEGAIPQPTERQGDE